MARIPIYESQVGRPVPNMPLRPYDTRNAFAGVSEALGAAADVSDRISQKFQTEEDNRTELNLRLKALQDFDEFNTSLEKRDDYQNFQGDYKSFVDKWQADNLAGVNDRVRASIMPAFGEMSIRNAADVRKSARDKQTGISLAQLDQNIADMQRAYTFAKTPEQRQTYIDLMNEAISMRVKDGVMSPVEGQKLWRTQQQQFGDTDVARALVENPAQLLKDLDDPEKYPWVVGDARYELQYKIKAKMEAEANARAAEYRSAIAARLDDEAAARANGETTGLTNKEILAAYGVEPGTKIITGMQRGADLNAATKTIANMNNEQEAALFASFKPEGEGYAVEQKMQAHLAEAIVAKHKAIAADPTAYVEQNNSTVKALFDVARGQGAPPDAWQKAIAANLEAQANLDVPVLERKPISDGDAAAFVGNWKNQSDPKAQFESLQYFVGQVSDPLLQKQLFAQLAKADLPADMRYVLDVAQDPAKRNQAIRLTAELAQKSVPETPSGVQKATIDGAIKDTYDDGIGGVWAYQLDITGNQQYAARRMADKEVLRKSALTRMQGEQDADNAFTTSYADLFGSKKAGGDTDIGRIVVPATADDDKLEDGMYRERKRVAELVTTQRQPLGPNPSEDDKRRVELWKETYEDTLRWVNEGDHYALVDTTTMQLVGDLQGKPYVATIDQLTGPGPQPLGPLGTTQVGTTKEGRPIIANPDGSYSTERSITVEVDGQWVNIPSMFGGKQLTQEQAVEVMRQNNWIDPETGNAAQFFDSLGAAEKAAKERSDSIQVPQ